MRVAVGAGCAGLMARVVLDWQNLVARLGLGGAVLLAGLQAVFVAAVMAFVLLLR